MKELLKELQNKNVMTESDHEWFERYNNVALECANLIYRNESEISNNRIELHYDDSSKYFFLDRDFMKKVIKTWKTRKNDELVFIVIDWANGLSRYIQLFELV